jgi:hypothetical protein
MADSEREARFDHAKRNNIPIADEPVLGQERLEALALLFLAAGATRTGKEQLWKRKCAARDFRPLARPMGHGDGREEPAVPTGAAVSLGNIVLFWGGRNHVASRGLPGGTEGIQTVMLLAALS